MPSWSSNCGVKWILFFLIYTFLNSHPCCWFSLSFSPTDFSRNFIRLVFISLSIPLLKMCNSTRLRAYSYRTHISLTGNNTLWTASLLIIWSHNRMYFFFTPSYENVMWNNVRRFICQDRWHLPVHHLPKNCYSVTKGYGTGITQFLLDKFILAITHLPLILQVLTVNLIYLFQLFGVFSMTCKLCWWVCNSTALPSSPL